MDKIALIRHMPLFESLSDDELNALVGRFETKHLEAGTAVFRMGEPGSSMFLIQDGEVEISTGEGAKKIVLASLFPGQFFGELSMFDGSPRSAHATAVKACTLQALDHEHFLAFMKAKPEAGPKILGEMAERLRQTNALFTQQVTRDVLEEHDDNLTLGQRVADSVAAFGGSWTFIFVFGFVMLAWMSVNAYMGEGKAFDPFPFILLNLALSTCAALQAPVIMMSQNRQASKDKLLAQNDYLVNLKAELGIQQIMKNQNELVARFQLMERQLGLKAAPTTNPASESRTA
jgi:uncharacterized membrane protein